MPLAFALYNKIRSVLQSGDNQKVSLCKSSTVTFIADTAKLVIREHAHVFLKKSRVCLDLSCTTKFIIASYAQSGLTVEKVPIYAHRRLKLGHFKYIVWTSKRTLDSTFTEKACSP